MKKSNHIWFAAVFVLVFMLILGWLRLNWISFSITSLLTMALITVFYSLLPDIDHKNSTITWWFFGIGVLGLTIGMLGLWLKLGFFNAWTIMIISALLIIFTYTSVILFKHRGIVHSIPVGILSIIPLFFVFHSFVYCLIGYVAWHSHLIGDGYLLKFK